ncbi:hypothetical protein AB0H71_28785 [Nocardia sp. NPDC050697]|uniref:hypothetical protein n=1 Tax=Nocardia sp. NPDC050697 TaxID=3155158 RepID=UPI0033E46CDE
MPPDQDFDVAVQVIRQMCQGDLLSLDKVESGDWEYAYPAFGVNSAVELYDLIKITAGSLMDDPDADAIRNALGLRDSYGPKGNLTDRRMRYLEEIDITLRSLQVREQKGAEMLVRQMIVMGRANPDIRERAEMKERIAKLEARLDRAEHRVYHLDRLRERTMAMMADLSILVRLIRDEKFDASGDYIGSADDPFFLTTYHLMSKLADLIGQAAITDDSNREEYNNWRRYFGALTGTSNLDVEVLKAFLLDRTKALFGPSISSDNVLAEFYPPYQQRYRQARSGPPDAPPFELV